jgi:hypothetical protein
MNSENLKKIKISNKTKVILINDVILHFQEFEMNEKFKTKILNENINNNSTTSLLSSINIINTKFLNVSEYMNDYYWKNITTYTGGDKEHEYVPDQESEQEYDQSTEEESSLIDKIKEMVLKRTYH